METCLNGFCSSAYAAAAAAAMTISCKRQGPVALHAARTVLGPVWIDAYSRRACMGSDGCRHRRSSSSDFTRAVWLVFMRVSSAAGAHVNPGSSSVHTQQPS
jgi:hypothetical protein